MATGKKAVLRHVRTLYDLGATRELTDGQLLERFASVGGEAGELAFAALVERHGPMVLRVCRGVLPDGHDTQDAFQATFLVLVRKARGLWVRDSIGPWLHQVALRTASGARADAARRRRHELRAAEAAAASGPAAPPTDGYGDLEGRLHAEIERLPERYRAPIVLCDLEGCSHEQAARHLGWPVGTVKSRQARGRARLRQRLTRLGLAPSAALPAQTNRPAPAGIPPALLSATTGAAARALSSLMAAGGPAAALAAEVLRAMTIARWLKLASLSLALTAPAAYLLAREGPRGDQPAAPAAGDEVRTAPVHRGPFRFTIDERGSVEAESSADVYSNVEGQTTITLIVPEGTRVKKGQTVAELDSAALKDQLVNQRIATQSAESAYRNAKLAREIAEIAVTEYEEGIYKQEVETARGELAAAEGGEERARKRLERTQSARERLREAIAANGGKGSASDVLAELKLDDRIDDAERLIQKEAFARELAQTRLKVLQQFRHDRTVRELKSKVEQARSGELARKEAWALEQSKEERLRKQIQSCRILAPVDGVVAYANDPVRAGRQGGAQIEEGAVVRERQKIVSIPDLSRVVVNVKTHEAWVDQVAPGQSATIKVDAFPDATLTGVVTQVAPLPDPPSSFPNGRAKVYSTRVRLDKPLPGLRPGMTADAQILIAEHDEALTVPVSAVVMPRNPRRTDRARVAVTTPGGGVSWREVTLGKSDGRVVEVKEGLKEGEPVALDPHSLLSEDERREAAPAVYDPAR